MGRAACSVIQILGHFTVSAQDEAALTHGDGELHVGARGFRRGAGTNAGPSVRGLGSRELPTRWAASGALIRMDQGPE